MNISSLFIYIFFLIYWFCLPAAHAIYLESTILDFPPKATFINKSIYNDSKNLNLYNIDIFEIDKPSYSGEQWKPVRNGMVLFTPLSFTLEPQESKIFKIFYRGPSDDIERYFRVVFRETPLIVFNYRENGRVSNFTPAIVLDAVLVVRPRKFNLKFEIDEKKGYIKNTGNTFFKAIVHNNCNSKDDEATVRYILPLEVWKSDDIKKTSKKFIVSLNQYIPISHLCDGYDVAP